MRMESVVVIADCPFCDKDVSIVSQNRCNVNAADTVSSLILRILRKWITHAVESLCLSPDDALTLQFAVQGLPFPDAPRRVRAFLAACATP
jgi:hypothetical protein